MQIALLLFCLLIGLNLALAVERPENNCNLFRYSVKDQGRTNIGVFTAHKENIKDFYWQAKFSARGLHKDQVDQLDAFPSRQELFANIQSGKKAEVFVRFQNIENNELPKLILFVLNGEWDMKPRRPQLPLDGGCPSTPTGDLNKKTLNVDTG